MKRQEPVLDLSCRGRHPKTVHEEVPMDSLFEIARVVLVAIAHGVTLGVLARRREGDGSVVLPMTLMTLAIIVAGTLMVFLIPAPASNVSLTAYMMLVVMGLFFCFVCTGTSLAGRLFIYIIYVAVFMLMVGFSQQLSAIVMPMYGDEVSLVIRTVLSIVLVVALRLFLKDMVYQLVDGFSGHGAEIVLFSWVVGLSILSYVLFAAFFVDDPVMNLVVLVILSLMMVSIFAIASRVMRLASSSVQMEKVIGRQRLLESELEAEKAFVEKARAIRHDQRHHDRVLLEYLDQGRVDDARRLLGAHERQIHDDGLRSWCSDPLMDAQIRIAWRWCTSRGIDFDVDVSLAGGTGLGDMECISVLGNLLENAMEAACGAPDPSIRLSVRVQEGRMLIEVVNTFRGQVEWVDGLPRTTKEGGGTGLESVRLILARHGGLLKQEVSGCLFISRVIMPLESA